MAQACYICLVWGKKARGPGLRDFGCHMFKVCKEHFRGVVVGKGGKDHAWSQSFRREVLADAWSWGAGEQGRNVRAQTGRRLGRTEWGLSLGVG